MRRGCLPAIATVRLLVSGCHSKYVEATITNKTGEPLNVVQVEYPTASFGTQLLNPGESFHYRFKLIGSGPIKLSYLDAAKHEHQQTGPSVNEGQEGRLTLVFKTQDHVDFETSLRP